MTPRFTTQIDARGSRGNIFEVVGAAGALMKQLGIPRDEIIDIQPRKGHARLPSRTRCGA